VKLLGVAVHESRKLVNLSKNSSDLSWSTIENRWQHSREWHDSPLFAGVGSGWGVVLVRS